MDTVKLNRISELTRISRERTLTPAETAERAALRTEYLREFRASMTGILDNTVIVRPDGSRERVAERAKATDTDLPKDKSSANKVSNNMKIPCVHHTDSVAKTEAFGAELAKLLLGDDTLPRFIALYGDLGVGKTAFVRGFASVASPDARVKSPTFALVHEYPAKTPVFHFDMYRINDDDELYSTGYYDYFSRGGYILTEWSENIQFALPERYISVEIVKDDTQYPDSRLITVRQQPPEKENDK